MSNNDSRPPGWFVAWFVFCAAVSVAALVFACWAIYRVVVHFT